MAINSAVRAVQAVHTFMGSPLSFCHVIRYLLLVNLGDQKVHKMVKFCVHQCTQTARRYEAPSLRTRHKSEVGQTIGLCRLSGTLHITEV